MQSSGRVHILTAELDSDSFEWLDGLRRRHFPLERNVLAAHLTLFHRVSPAQAAQIERADFPGHPILISFDCLVLLGFGVAVMVRSTGLQTLRAALRHAMGGEFSRQDIQTWRPHVTIQNKVSPERAKDLFHALQTSFVPRVGAVTAVLEWEYLGGPWRPLRKLPIGRR